MRDSETFSMAQGKKSVMVSRTAPYRETAMNTLLADNLFPVST